MDRKKLAIIHIVKKELYLSDKDYREILMKVAGVKSSKDLSTEGFRKLMNYLVRHKRYYLKKSELTLRQKNFIQNLVCDIGWSEEALNVFLVKYFKKPQLSELSKKEAIGVIEALKNIKFRRLQTRHAA